MGNSKILMKNMPELSYSTEEAVNRLRINLSFLGNDVRKIMIISCTENEGKSFVAMHLWRQMAQAGTPCILVDTDLRKSVMVDKYQMELKGGGDILGTSHVLANGTPPEKAVYHTEIEQGDILPNVENVVNPALLLESRHFTDLLDKLSESYRYVFVDAPPLNLVSDGERIGSLCDGAIVVVHSGMTTRKMLRHTLQLLERSGCPLLGVVLNCVADTKGKYSYSKSNYYYLGGYGSRDARRETKKK